MASPTSPQPSDSAPTVPPDFLVAPTRSGIDRVARVISEGNLAILPTETVYGIAVNLHSSRARDAARSIKARSTQSTANTEINSDSATPAPSNPWVVHVSQPEDVLAWAPHLSPVAKRLIMKSLPGPVAFQIKLDPADEVLARQRLGDAADESIDNHFLTLRCPDLSRTQEVLAAINAPVAIIGAGTPQKPGIFDLQELPDFLHQGPDAPKVALDAGPTRYRRSSTLVRIDGHGYSVVRPGVIDERIIHRLADLTILFICSGNTCRSPMAAALASKQIATRFGIPAADLPLRHIMVLSAGLHASRGMRATLEAQDAVKNLGADLSAHISQPATPELLRRADAIYTMTSAHRDEVLDIVPGSDRKTFMIDPDGDVADPIGASLSVYQRVASRLNTLLQKHLSELIV